MKNIKHPYGNTKSLVLKSIKKFLQNFIKFFVNFFCKLDDNDEIIISSATHSPWLKDKKFYIFFDKIKNYTLLDYPRAYTLWQCVNNVSKINGMILDIGCLLGGSGFIMSKANKNGTVHLFDSFTGFKKDDGLHKKETFFSFVRNEKTNLFFSGKNIYRDLSKKGKIKSFFIFNSPIHIVPANFFFDTGIEGMKKDIHYFVKRT